MNDKKFLDYVKQYKDELYSFIAHTLNDKSSIDDVFSEAILVAYKNKDKFIEGTNFKAWLYKILLNKCFVANRDISLYWEPIDEYSDKLINLPEWHNGYDKWDPEKNIENFLENCSDEVYEAFSKLSRLQKMCIYLKDIENFSYKEIADILSIPLASVMTHLSRGRAKLRKILSAKYRDIHKSNNIKNEKGINQLETTSL